MASSTRQAFLNMGYFDIFSSNSDEEMFQRICRQNWIVFTFVVAGDNILALFNANELEFSVGQLVN
jgi:hypothetical protein